MGSKIPAAQFRENLGKIPGMKKESIDRMTAEGIKAGDVAPDGEGGAFVVDLSDVLKSANALAGVQDSADAIERPNDGKDVFKGETASEVIAAVRGLIASVETMVDHLQNTDPVLADGIRAVGQATQDVAKSLNSLQDEHTSLLDRFEKLTDKLGLPVPPRTVTASAAALPHPQDVGTDGKLVEKGGRAKVTDITTASLRRGLLKARASAAANGDNDTRSQVNEAIGLLDAGANPAYVVRKYGFEF